MTGTTLRKARRAARLGAILGLALALVGCGSELPPASAGPSAPPPLVAQASPDPAISARPSAAPSPSPSVSVAPAAKVGERLLVAERQYLTVVRAEQWRGRAPTPNARFVAVLVRVEGVRNAPYNANLFAVDTGESRNRVANHGKIPRFASGPRLVEGRTYEAWLTFSIPLECRCELLYSLPIGNGQRSEPVRVLLDPIGPATPDVVPTADPSARPTQIPELAGIGPTFFGPNVTIETYEVDGRSRLEILRSTQSNGPRLAWLNGRATALTQVDPSFNFDVRSTSAGCQLVTTGTAAVTMEFVVTLPAWDRPSGVSANIVDWWNDELRAIAVHERTHVELYREALEELNEVVASANCADVSTRLQRVWRDVSREQCEFDMDEYGAELGLKLEDCLAQAG